MKNTNETNPEAKYRFGVISDTQERKGPEVAKVLEPLRRLENEGVELDFITHLGDLASSGAISKYVKEAKRLAGSYDMEKDQGEFTDEIKQYEKTVNSPEYQEFEADLKNKGIDQDIVVYALWSAEKHGELDRALKDMELLHKNVIDQLGEFKSEVRHIMGNADRGFPQRFEAIQRLLKEYNIASYDHPVHLSLDQETSIVFWPSMKVDENDKEQASSLQKLIDRFASDMKDKKSVLIFAHETPFKGPKKPGVYEKRVKGAGIEGSERVPYQQFSPVSRYVLELARRLPAKAKIAIVAGHMHVSRETIEAGTQYIKFDEEGKAKMRLFGADSQKNYETIPGGKRTFDLYYLPEGEVGTFEIKDDGRIEYKKLSENKE